MLTIRIDTTNAPDLARLLTELAGLFNSGLPDEVCCGRLRDAYGKHCGRWRYEPAVECTHVQAKETV